MKRAIYPGSFDPITLGHLDIIKRSALCFDQLIVCVMVNSAKTGFFSPEERRASIEKVVKDIPNVKVDSSALLLAEYAREKDVQVVVKGLRDSMDFQAEMQMALINRKLNPQLDTMFLPSNQQLSYLSSSMVKEMVQYGVDLEDFIPKEIIDEVKEKGHRRATQWQ